MCNFDIGVGRAGNGVRVCVAINVGVENSVRVSERWGGFSAVLVQQTCGREHRQQRGSVKKRVCSHLLTNVLQSRTTCWSAGVGVFVVRAVIYA